MKRKITIGFWIAVIVIVVGFATVILNDLRIERIGRETREILRTTIISVDFDSVPLDEAWQLIRKEAIKANPEFVKIEFDSSRVMETKFGVGSGSPEITLVMPKAPLVEVVRYSSSQGLMRYHIEGRTVHLQNFHADHRSMTAKIRWRIYKITAKWGLLESLEPDPFQ